MTKRWAFLAVCVVCALSVGGLTVGLTLEVQKIRRVARQADQTTLQLKQQGVIRRQLRNDQLAQLQRQAVIDCNGRHRIVQVLTRLTKQSGVFPDLTPEQQRVLAAQQAKALKALRNADCTHVKPLMKGT